MARLQTTKQTNGKTWEYQVKRNFQWVPCSYQTYLKHRKNGYPARKGMLAVGWIYSN